MAAVANKFCKLDNLHNESDVEQNLVVKLLDELGFTEDYRESKSTIRPENIGKAAKRRSYIPDFICYSDKKHTKPSIILDAKSPSESAEDGVSDAQLYTAVMRRRLPAPKPDQLCVGVNGRTLIVRHFDEATTLYELRFEQFLDGNPAFREFSERVSREYLRVHFKTGPMDDLFEFHKPTVAGIIAIFEACHNLVWKKEKIPPAEAFYEFAKILFVKLRKDRALHGKARAGPMRASDVEFSVNWIEEREQSDPNPINSVLFRNLRTELEDEIRLGAKKRMFAPDENIRLSASTVKEVVRLLEHEDLYAIDEDLNGRMFETFLTAVIRGRSLGQFFTPRTVVKFMVDMTGLRLEGKRIPRIIDACCGTGGFLIEAMARLTDSINSRPGMTSGERASLLQELQHECLWGIEANETIARIARINMYLHQDGGSRIYKADALDKEFLRDRALEGEPKRDFEELKASLTKDGKTFDVALTNPPFAMRYEAKKQDEKRILYQYEVREASGTGKAAASLRSSILFLERYYDLLTPGGSLLTIIDDSVLNTSTTASVRRWVRDHYFVRAVISLPKNCFVAAGSAAKTSVLLLEKKDLPSPDQPDVFMGISKNVGHTESGKPELKSNDLPSILAEWKRLHETGTVPTKEGCFVVRSANLEDRLDVQWYDPIYAELYHRLDGVAHRVLAQIPLSLKYGTSAKAGYQGGVPFIRIENLDRNEIDLSDLQYVPENLLGSQLEKLYLKAGDVLIARSGTYVGLCAAVPKGLEGYVYGSYIIRLRLKEGSEFDPFFLAIYLNSRLGQMQFDRLKTGSLQYNINIDQIRSVLVPSLSMAQQRQIVRQFNAKHQEIITARQSVKKLEAAIVESTGESIVRRAGIKGHLALRDFTGE
jgi:type I restriction enzyme M protein